MPFNCFDDYRLIHITTTGYHISSLRAQAPTPFDHANRQDFLETSLSQDQLLPFHAGGPSPVQRRRKWNLSVLRSISQPGLIGGYGHLCNTIRKKALPGL